MERPTRAEHYPLFDGLRGLAALFVFLYHCLFQFAVVAGQGEWWWRFGIHMDVAVPMFMAISGFLLYRPFVAARARGRRMPDVRRYAVRRALRLVPGYWSWLIVITVWLSLPGVFTPTGIPIYFGFAQIYSTETALGGIGQAWTLGIEVAFYAFLPLWALVVRRRPFSVRLELAGLAALVALSWTYKLGVLAQGVDLNTVGGLRLLFPMPAYLDMLAVGMAVAVLSVGEPPRLLRERPGLVWTAAWAFWLLACLAGPSGRPEDPVDATTYAVRHLLYTCFVALLVAPAAVRTSARVLSWRPIANLGVISYSFYLVHIAVVVQVARWADEAPVAVHEWTLWVLACLAGSVALGSLGYWLVERPAMQLGRRA